MFTPAPLAINPPVRVSFQGRVIFCGSAREGLEKLRQDLRVTPDDEQGFLEQLHIINPDLVHGGDVGLSVGLWQVIAYLKALKKRWTTDADPFVSLEEATYRAEICLGCKYNMAVTGCSECKGFANHLMQVPEGLTIPVQSCAKCGCHLPTKVWLSPQVLNEDPREIAWPSWCWMAHGRPPYRSRE